MDSEEESNLSDSDLRSDKISEGETDFYDSDLQSITELKSTSDYIFALRISNKLRQIFNLILLMGNFFSLNLGMLFMLLSWYVKNSLSKQIIFLRDFYNPQTVPVMLFLPGVIMIVASLLGIKAAIGGRATDDGTKAKSVALFYFLYWIAGAVSIGAVFFAAIICFSEIRIIQEAMSRGLKAGMEKYIKSTTIKRAMDYLQMFYQCCGVEGYKDWFNISWVDVKYLDSADPSISRRLRDGKYFGKDVPFSCCNKAIIRPCVDTRIDDNSYHSNYNYPTDLTLYTDGCRERVTRSLGKVFRGVGAFVFSCILFWIVMTVIGRYLHTSTTQIQMGKQPIGWIIPYSKAAKVSKTSEEDILEEEYSN